MKKYLTIEEHYERMHHHKITDKEFNEYGAIWTLSINAREKIKERLEKGYKVKTGWTTSAIRGYHHYYILFKC